MRISILAFVIAALAGTLQTGAVQAGDWSGSYAGGQTGSRNSAASADGGAAIYGLHGGYDVDYGAVVLGGELEFERMHLVQGSGAQILGNVGRLKFRAGRDLGSTMAYAIVGGVTGDTPVGNETGVVYGLGLLKAVGNHLTLSGEALRQVFGNFTRSGTDLKTDSFNVRVSFRF